MVEVSGRWFIDQEEPEPGDLVATTPVTRRFELTDGQWAVLAPLLPQPERSGRPPLWNRRQLNDAIRWRIRVGAPWREVPMEYGSWQAAYATKPSYTSRRSTNGSTRFATDPRVWLSSASSAAVDSSVMWRDDQMNVPQALARPASAADLSKVVRLVSVMFADLGTQTDSSWEARTREVLTSRLWTDVGVFVVDPEPAGTLAACAVGLIHQSLPSPRRQTQAVGYVEWVVADPAWRRQGHAFAATAALVQWLIDQRCAVIDVHSSATAEPLYRRIGFTSEGPVAMRLRTTPTHGLG